MLVPKVNGKLRLCIDPARLNKVLIRPVHRGLTLNNTLPRLAGVKYLMIIDASSGYQNLNLDEKSSYLTTWQVLLHKTTICSSPSGRNVPEENRQIIQQHSKWHKDYEETLEKVLWVHRKTNLKLNKNK